MTAQERLEEIKSKFSDYDAWKYEEELKWLIEQAEQVHALKCELGSLKAKAKNKERARRRKDNYINRLQNQLIAIKEVNKKRNQQLEQARESLGFYADEETYNLTGEKVYTGHGSYDESCWREIERDMGAKARQTLEELK